MCVCGGGRVYRWIWEVRQQAPWQNHEQKHRAGWTVIYLQWKGEGGSIKQGSRGRHTNVCVVFYNSQGPVLLAISSNHCQMEKPRSSTGAQGHSLEIMPRALCFHLPRGEIPGFLVIMAWGWRPKDNGRGVLAARCTPTTEPSPNLAVLFKFSGPRFFLYKMGMMTESDSLSCKDERR